jgi:hypothetical protein
VSHSAPDSLVPKVSSSIDPSTLSGEILVAYSGRIESVEKSVLGFTNVYEIEFSFAYVQTVWTSGNASQRVLAVLNSTTVQKLNNLTRRSAILFR